MQNIESNIGQASKRLTHSLHLSLHLLQKCTFDTCVRTHNIRYNYSSTIDDIQFYKSNIVT